ncbi:PREDICTED: polypyrimidine tract-binding protein 3-like, partial [Leptosomus discolor]|uniref:polypyrimidine tract-binding protein 3-like n=1 Tax=Leptosomus discolor TaxID=188344 RepID=UPI000522CEE5
RGPDELLFSGVSNKPFTMDKSTQDTDNENERKKFKRDRLSRSPSRVLHLHQVASDATEEEVISLGHPFGKVTNLLMLKGRNQALLEMASEEVAIAMVNYYALAIPHIRGQPVYIQYSHYSELKTDNLPDQARAQAALKAQNTAQPGVVAVRRAIAAEGGLVPCQGSVLRIVVENLFYFVGLEVLHQIFSKFGLVLKIVTFSRNNQFQALLEYGDPMNAYRAKMALDGQSIYSGCCTLRIDFSKISRLKVKYNNEKSRDFTRFDLPPGDSESFMEPSIRAAF